MKFIVGKWYKNIKDGDIGKLSSNPTKLNFPSIQYICKEIYYGYGSYYSWNLDDVVLADYHEYSQFLPRNHPDLIVKSQDCSYLIKILKKYNIV